MITTERTTTDTCLYLAQIGYAHLCDLKHISTIPDDEGDPEAIEVTRLADHAAVRRLLVEADKPLPRAGDLNGAKWLTGVITWPDRVPGLKTWAAKSTLAHIIAKHQRRLADAEGAVDLYAVRGYYQTSKGEGPSGLDALTCQDAIDIGFSPSQLKMDIQCRPAVELLAIIGLETLPLISFEPRVCGFLHDGKMWRFTVEERSGGYFYRWGELVESE